MPKLYVRYQVKLNYFEFVIRLIMYNLLPNVCHLFQICLDDDLLLCVKHCFLGNFNHKTHYFTVERSTINKYYMENGIVPRNSYWHQISHRKAKLIHRKLTNLTLLEIS